MKKLFSLLLVGVAMASMSSGQVRTETVEYRQGDVVLQGYLAYDASIKGKRPAVLVVHNWYGISESTRIRVDQLAALGYVAFAADIYGKGIRPADAAAASAESGKYYKDRGLLRARTRAGLDFLSARPEADPARLAAIGYCFGGSAVLELARSGAPVKATVTFHGGLSTPTPADAKNIKGKMLVLHGADDPYVKQDDVTAFMKEMREAGVDWQLVQYSGTVHSFTDKGAGSDNSTGAAYNESSDRRSWKAMKDFFEEIFPAR